MAAESRPVFDGETRHADLAADQRRASADDQAVVRGHGPADLARTGDLDVASGLELSLDIARHAQVALDVQLADEAVVRPEDYRAALVSVGAVRLRRGRGLEPTARTPGAQSHPSEHGR